MLPILALTIGCADLSDDVRRLEDRVTDLEDRFAVLEGQFNSLVIVSSDLSDTIAANAAQAALLQAAQSNVNAQLDAAIAAGNAAQAALLQAEAAQLQAQIDALNTQQTALQAQVNTVQASADAAQLQLTELSLEERVTGFLDPCGDAVGIYDEVLLTTNSGKVVAYFEIGSKRFLSILLPNVWYQTTDQQSCVFKVDSNGNLVY